MNFKLKLAVAAAAAALTCAPAFADDVAIDTGKDAALVSFSTDISGRADSFGESV